jgi:hypothetical protein
MATITINQDGAQPVYEIPCACGCGKVVEVTDMMKEVAGKSSWYAADHGGSKSVCAKKADGSLIPFKAP